jgi:hypothetical protein
MKRSRHFLVASATAAVRTTKPATKYVMAGILALTIVSSTFAQTKIYITGSTSFRSATFRGVSAILSAAVSIAYDGRTNGITSASDANAVTWTGGNIGGTAVTIKASWSGSVAGILTVAAAPNFPVRFLPDGASGSNNLDPRDPNNPAELAVPDVAMSDVYQSSTPFHGTPQYANLVDNPIAVVTYVWAASKNFPLGTGSGTSSSHAMTRQLAQALFPTGLIPLSMITGSASDHDIGVFATGRDFYSGARVTAMAETGVGLHTLLAQYKPIISDMMITHFEPYPIGGGESSGSSLRTFLVNTVTTGAAQEVDPTLTGGFLMTYLGVSDYNNVSASAVKLRYAGNDFSQQAVEEGVYTFWACEHLDYKNTISGIKGTFASNLKNHLRSETSADLNPNVALSDMQVQRFSDGGIITSLLH